MKKIQTAAAAASILKKAPSLIVTTHKNADGDGLGAGMALLRGLKQLGKKAVFRTLEKPDIKYRFLDPGGALIQPFDKAPGGKSAASARLARRSASPPLIAALDTSDFRTLEPFYSAIKSQGAASVFFIDHHVVERRLMRPGDLFFVDSKASSTGELVYKILKKMGAKMDSKTAHALYASIVFDTKSFRFIKNSSAPFSICKDLLAFMPRASAAHENLFKNIPQKSLGFFQLLSKAQFRKNGALAFLRLSERDFKRFSAPVWKAYELLDILMNVASVRAAVLIIDRGREGCRLSFRSTDDRALRFAKAFGGGGHGASAGAAVAPRRGLSGPKVSLGGIQRKVLSLWDNN